MPPDQWSVWLTAHFIAVVSVDCTTVICADFQQVIKLGVGLHLGPIIYIHTYNISYIIYARGYTLIQAHTYINVYAYKCK